MTFVATRSVWVGPGVKMDWKRSVMKADMISDVRLSGDGQYRWR